MATMTTAIDSHQYLTFVLAEQSYALQISRVREVLEMTRITRVPRTPGYMRGVINLRGAVVPVVDLRERFGLGRTEQTVDTCIVISEIDLGGDVAVVGLLADSVQEVLEIVPESIEPPPRFGTVVDTTYIRGMGRRDDGFAIILEISSVFSREEFAQLPKTAE